MKKEISHPFTAEDFDNLSPEAIESCRKMSREELKKRACYMIALGHPLVAFEMIRLKNYLDKKHA